MSDSLWPHGLQHTRLPCTSQSSRVCSNSCPLSLWCHPTILCSVVLFPSCLQCFPASGSFPMNRLFAGGQNIGASASASASVLPTIDGSRPHNRLPNWRIWKRDCVSPVIWLWKSAGFDYRISRGLGTQRLLEGTNKTLCTPGPRRKYQWLLTLFLDYISSGCIS